LVIPERASQDLDLGYPALVGGLLGGVRRPTPLTLEDLTTLPSLRMTKVKTQEILPGRKRRIHLSLTLTPMRSKEVRNLLR
jgi:hypothetical protein